MKTTYIGLMSGGQDSSAMILKLLSENKPLDIILFDDTLLEFDLMYDYIVKFNKYIKNNYSKEITFAKPKNNSNFFEWCFGVVKRGERKGYVRGIPMMTVPCYWKRESKVYATDYFIKKNNIENPVFYVGYTFSEKNRANNKEENQIYPLIDWKMCEADVNRLLTSKNLVNPLYNYFNRTGCSICPYQSDRSFYVIMKKFPEDWNRMKFIEHELKRLENRDIKVINSQWHETLSIEDFEKKLIRKDFDLQAPMPCECKIPVLDNQTKLDLKFLY